MTEYRVVAETNGFGAIRYAVEARYPWPDHDPNKGWFPLDSFKDRRRAERHLEKKRYAALANDWRRVEP